MAALALPTSQQCEWADREIGVIIHTDLTTFVDHYDYFNDQRGLLPPETFAPDQLDTDQWVRAAKDMGAGYAVLVAKHCTGFCLWPTAEHNYSIAATAYQGGKGDVVADFFASCKKYDVKPGLYYSAAFNQYMDVDNPGTVRDGDPAKQKAYNEMVLRQLTELWTQYGDVFEIWFDGGVLPPEQGGPDVVGLLKRLQPNAVVFQGPAGLKSLLRWVGNERGIAAENCSAVFRFRHMAFDGTEEMLDCGDPDGDTWCPAESDYPNRSAKKSSYGGWFWGRNESNAVIPAETMFENYLCSVGRNTNMLVGMAIDRHGRFDDVDAAQFHRFGEMRRAAFGTVIAEAEMQAGRTEYVLSAPAGAKYAMLGEEIAWGERVAAYTLTQLDAAGKELARYAGTVISHKRILPLDPDARTVRLTIDRTRGDGEVRMRLFRLY